MNNDVYDSSKINNYPKCNSRLFDDPNETTLWPDPPCQKISCSDCEFAAYAFQEEDVIKEWNNIYE